MIFTFAVNGTTVTVKSHPMRRLLDVLREDLGLSGTKEGCGEGECGACASGVTGGRPSVPGRGAWVASGRP